jgi:DNA-3-methyladenine glycosylase I
VRQEAFPRAPEASSALAVSEDGIVVGEDGVARCWWADSAPEYREYHDTEWGFPVAEDVRLFEKLSLEGFQAGLSWLTILRKRPAFRRAFAGFELERVARFDEGDVARLLADAGIVRHRGKIEAAINNAARALELVQSEGSLARYVWRFEPEARSGRLDRAGLADVVLTAESTALARDLKRRGWRFVGPTTVYAFMQAMGLVNDHLGGCDARKRAAGARERFVRP